MTVTVQKHGYVIIYAAELGGCPALPQHQEPAAADKKT
jgi:hypothetical protein